MIAPTYAPINSRRVQCDCGAEMLDYGRDTFLWCDACGQPSSIAQLPTVLPN